MDSTGDRSARPAASRRRYRRDGLVIGLAVGVFGVAFGVLATSSGLTIAQACVMSLLVFTGASQFAAVSVIGAGGDPATAIGSGLLLGARNALYGLTMAKHLTGGLLRRMAVAQLTIDESTALAAAQDRDQDREGAFLAGGMSVFVFWNLGTLIGAAGGDAIADPNVFGLDAAFPAGFVALAAPSLRHRSGQTAAVVGAAIAAAAIPFSRPGLPILLAGVGAIVALVVVGPPPPPQQEATS